MSKIGTAHVEVKPVVNTEAWDKAIADISKRLEDSCAEAVERGLLRGLGAAKDA